jgi:hypothetical protein
MMVWVRSRSAPNRIILKYNGISQINGSYGFCQNLVRAKVNLGPSQRP